MRKPKKSAYDDPVVDEVRKIRAELWRQAGGTVAGYIRLMEERLATRLAVAEKNGVSAGKGQTTAAKNVAAQTDDKPSSKRPKVHSSVRELAGSLSHYAVGLNDESQISEYVRQEVARAAAQEG